MSNPFINSINKLPETERERLAQRFADWDSDTQTAAGKRVRYLETLLIDSPASLVVDELEHGLEHTGTIAFLQTLREWAEGIIRDRLQSRTYPQAIGDTGAAAIARFHSTLTESEQMEVLRAFAIEMMDAFGEMLEHGVDDSACPVNWALVNPETGRRVAGALHETFDGDPENDDTFLPRIDDSST